MLDRRGRVDEPAGVSERYQAIYEQRAADYQALVEREDHEGNLMPAIAASCRLAGARVVEVGAGTGRLTCMLAPYVAHIDAFDRAPAMLEVARARLRALGQHHCALAVADARSLPIADGVADLAIEGWCFGHLAGTPAIDEALAELRRVLRPGGAAMLVETLGTGCEEPTPPSPVLAALYRRLTDELGYRHRWVRTDYLFASASEARRLTEFFFGRAVPITTLADGRARVPECTGIWWRSFPERRLTLDRRARSTSTGPLVPDRKARKIAVRVATGVRPRRRRS